MKENYHIIDTIDRYNKWYSKETLHPLVTVLNHDIPPERFNGATLRYGVYGLFLKQGDGCSVRYGREKYDYQEGTVVTYAPGQTVTVEWNADLPMPPSRGLLFHPDLLHGTSLDKKINSYTFFEYGQREALHLSQRERTVISSLLDQIENEIENPVDRHSQVIITDAISMLLDYCMRYYDRQFVTRHKVCSDVFSSFEHQLKKYFDSESPEKYGIPTVAYFAEKACLSTGYFGDLIKKETGATAQSYIQDTVINRSKQLLTEGTMSVSEISYKLGFQYAQHFTRLFKTKTGITPNEYRKQKNMVH
ncbi:MAG: helix-turn-helix domain-containing protein [Bacteroidales bacterium]|nr:helix-turn-helix domain-containing protein [Bacteroidales bacterium]